MTGPDAEYFESQADGEGEAILLRSRYQMAQQSRSNPHG